MTPSKHWPDCRYDYRGARVLVTGGSNGIGAGIAAAYLAAGAEVTITGTRPSASDYEQDLSGYHYLPLQLTDNSSIDAVAAALPALDILVNNAGGNFMQEDEYAPEVFEKSIQVNLLSAYRLARACHGKLAASTLPGGAAVIGLASMTSYFGVEVVPGYGAAKAGLVQLTKTLSMHWARDSIRVNAVAAGLIHSNMTAGFLAHEQATAPSLARTPLGRFGQPLDIAGPVLFLSSSAAAYITGQTLPVDGGFSIAG
ncbi:SDR family NAD(P)-dependent oxidoreductase [Parahaliea mediterranea]|uniref:SDR family NAD(P)-dependent oxidoreductase n=1 Tax=Parahaliea mediterranea TaxID=651086 RepID=UPI000E2F9B5C|nr:SDR family NAD(P)-dependent oxidoreductase [Parahaliea mediterranea]